MPRKAHINIHTNWHSSSSQKIRQTNQTNKSTQILLPLYKTLVRPFVEYCTRAWSPHYSKDKRMIERIQH
jgi:hypothetical protein